MKLVSWLVRWFVCSLVGLLVCSCGQTYHTTIRATLETLDVPVIYSEAKITSQDSEVIIAPIFSSQLEMFTDTTLTPEHKPLIQKKQRPKQIGTVMINKKDSIVTVSLQPDDLLRQRLDTTQSVEYKPPINFWSKFQWVIICGVLFLICVFGFVIYKKL